MPADPQIEPKDPLPQPGLEPRRLTRSTTDKYVAGVAGGLARSFGVDPIIFRIAFAAATLVSGIGLVAYIAFVAFLPTDDGEPAWIEGRSRVTSVIAIGALCVIALTTLAPPAFFLGPGLLGVAAVTALGLVLYRVFGGARGDDPARAIARATLALIALAAVLGAATGIGLLAALGGGPAMAAIAIFAGLMLITVGFLGGPRWLILPVTVLVLPLAVVSAADLDLRGGAGERLIRPSTAAELEPEYRLGDRPHRPRPARRGAVGRAEDGQAESRDGRGLRARPARYVRRHARPDRRRRGRPAAARRRGRQPRHRARRAEARDAGVGRRDRGRASASGRRRLRVRERRPDRTLIVAGLATVALGTLLLLDRIGTIDVRFNYMAPAVLAAIGVVLLTAGLSE